MPNTAATSLMTSDMKTDPLSVIFSVGRYGCLVMMSMMTFAEFIAVGVETGCAETYLEKNVNCCNNVLVTSTRW